jgi:hypothetical protein
MPKLLRVSADLVLPCIPAYGGDHLLHCPSWLFYPYPSTPSLILFMIQNYLTVALRNLIRNRVYSFLSLSGLASGMAVALLVRLWMQDGLSFDQTFQNFDRIAKVWQFVQFDAEKASCDVMPVPLAEEPRSNYSDFESVSLVVPELGTTLKRIRGIGATRLLPGSAAGLVLPVGWLENYTYRTPLS